jgi:hypothetical protein
MKRSELVQNVINWNNRFPLDRWWRIKHNVAFMSPVHRESSFIHQLMNRDFIPGVSVTKQIIEEDKLFMPDISEEVKYVPGVGDFLKTKQTLENFADEAQEEIKKMLKMEGNG